MTVFRNHRGCRLAGSVRNFPKNTNTLHDVSIHGPYQYYHRSSDLMRIFHHLKLIKNYTVLQLQYWRTWRGDGGGELGR
jgi:hypothetical protein